MRATPPVPPDIPVPPYEPRTGYAGHPAAEQTAVPAGSIAGGRMDAGMLLNPLDLDVQSVGSFSIDDLEVARALTGLRAGKPTLAK